MANKKNSRSSNKSGKNDSKKNDSCKKFPDVRQQKGVIEKTISKENRRKKSPRTRSIEAIRNSIIAANVSNDDLANLNDEKSKPSGLKPNANNTDQAPPSPCPKSPLPQKHSKCVICGTEHVQPELSRHFEGRPHQQAITFLQDFKDAIEPGKEKPGKHYTKLTGEVLKHRKTWKCHACDTHLPKPADLREHLLSGGHEDVVGKLWKGLQERREFVAGLQKNQVPKDLDHTFY